MMTGHEADVDLDETTRRHLAALAAPPMQNEQKLFEALLVLQPVLMPRVDTPVSLPGDCHGNVVRFIDAKPSGKFGMLHGWADLGSYMVLHSVVIALDWLEGENLACVTPGILDWTVFRPDPALKLVEPWTFERDGVEMPTLVRRDPDATTEEVQRVLTELRAGTREGWGLDPTIAGDPYGAEPARVQEWARLHAR